MATTILTGKSDRSSLVSNRSLPPSLPVSLFITRPTELSTESGPWWAKAACKNRMPKRSLAWHCCARAARGGGYVMCRHKLAEERPRRHPRSQQCCRQQRGVGQPPHGVRSSRPVKCHSLRGSLRVPRRCILGWKSHFSRQIRYTRTHINYRFWALIHKDRCRKHKFTAVSRLLQWFARSSTPSLPSDTGLSLKNTRAPARQSQHAALRDMLLLQTQLLPFLLLLCIYCIYSFYHEH